MRRVKDILESDVVRRNPLNPTVGNYSLHGKDDVVVTDSNDDIDTLDGRINARGRADDYRRLYVDKARRLNNIVEISRKILPEFKLLREQVESHTLDYETTRKLRDVERLLNSFIEDDGFGGEYGLADMELVKDGARRPIYVGDMTTGNAEYAGHVPPWRRFG